MLYEWRAEDGGVHQLVRLAWWRYGITPDAHDGCIGFRLALAPSA